MASPAPPIDHVDQILTQSRSGRDGSPCSPAPIDHVDQILTQWAVARPDLDASPMGVIGRICRLGSLLTKEQVRVFAQYDLDFASFDVLATLRRNGPPYELTPGQLARSMIVTPSAVAQRLTRLEATGLITRSRTSSDRRVITVALTDRGQELVDIALPAHLANEQRLLAGFAAADLEVLAALLQRLLVSQGDVPV
jgi:DNA-binding MarR family transcriptional regulator